MEAQTPARRAVVRRVAEAILALRTVGRTRVGIDGIDGAGKSTFGDELGDVLASRDRHVLRATVDRFHHPRSVRYRLGKASPEGFYRDSYDYAALRSVLLDPLSPGGDGRIRRGIFDVDADAPVAAPTEEVPADAILVFDGMFLHRPELRGYWDYSVFLLVDWPRNHHLRKLLERGPVDPAEARFRRYHEGQNIYFRECTPWARATVVIDNHDLSAPIVVTAAPDGRASSRTPPTLFGARGPDP